MTRGVVLGSTVVEPEPVKQAVRLLTFLIASEAHAGDL